MFNLNIYYIVLIKGIKVIFGSDFFEYNIGYKWGNQLKGVSLRFFEYFYLG